MAELEPLEFRIFAATGGKEDVPTPEEFLGEALGTWSIISEQAPFSPCSYMRKVLLCLSGPATGDSKLT